MTHQEKPQLIDIDDVDGSLPTSPSERSSFGIPNKHNLCVLDQNSADEGSLRQYYNLSSFNKREQPLVQGVYSSVLPPLVKVKSHEEKSRYSNSLSGESGNSS